MHDAFLARRLFGKITWYVMRHLPAITPTLCMRKKFYELLSVFLHTVCL